MVGRRGEEREAPDTLSRTLLGLAVGGAKKKAKEPGNKCLGVGVLGVGVLPVQHSSLYSRFLLLPSLTYLFISHLLHTHIQFSEGSCGRYFNLYHMI